MSDILQSRKIAIAALQQIIKERKDVDAALDKLDVGPQDKKFIYLMVMTTLRHIRVIDALLAQFMQKPVASDYVMHVLRLGAAQLLWLDVPQHAAVHTSVELVKQSKFRGFAKLVNAILQNITRKGKEALDNVDIASHAAPKWLMASWIKDYGTETAKQIALSVLQEPALDLSVKNNASQWAEILEGTVLPTGSIRLHNAAPVVMLEGFNDGEWWVQDMAASIPAQLLGDVKGKHILDLCAAPGGKTAQLIAAGAKVTALDKSTKRMERLRSNLKRLQMEAEIVAADALNWTPKEQYDAILLDAPCSATGTLRRHPEIALHKSAKDVEELSNLQWQMLNRALDWLKPQGMLVYATCSLEKQEGEVQIERLLKERNDVKLASTPAHLVQWQIKEGMIRTLPHYMAEQGGMDGFFAAIMVKA